MSTRTNRTEFRELSADECLAILTRNNVGRLAFTFHDRVDIEPINYLTFDGDLLFRTAPGSKVEVLRHHPWVAFEVDEIDGLLEWRSVVVHGTIYRVEGSGHSGAPLEFERAVERLRALLPEGSQEHPLDARPLVLKLHIDRMTGREARKA